MLHWANRSTFYSVFLCFELAVVN